MRLNDMWLSCYGVTEEAGSNNLPISSKVYVGRYRRYNSRFNVIA
jgi:hypothetical protein